MTDGMNVDRISGVKGPSEIERTERRRKLESGENTESPDKIRDRVEISHRAEEIPEADRVDRPEADTASDITEEEKKIAAEGWYSQGYARAYIAANGLE